MTAYLPTQQLDRVSPAAPPNCLHPRLSLGLDSAYCPDCRRNFGPRSREYRDYLNKNTPAPDKLTGAHSLSGASPKPLQAVHLNSEQKSAPDKHWVEVYSPAKRIDSYYRYVWMSGRKLNHIHIRGGHSKAPLALARKAQIENAIAHGSSPTQIEQMIKSWRQPANG